MTRWRLRIAGASEGNLEGLHTLGTELHSALPGSRLGFLAEGIAYNLEGKHAEALAPLDNLYTVRPNDPVVVHHAGGRPSL